MKYVPPVCSPEVYRSVLDLDKYDFRPYLTDAVVGCARRLLAESKAWIADRSRPREMGDAPVLPCGEVLGMSRSMLSDAMRDAGLTADDIHVELAFRSIMIAELINSQYREIEKLKEIDCAADQARKSKETEGR